MASFTIETETHQEISRLKSLLPPNWHEEIAICPYPVQKAGRGSHPQPLIVTRKIAPRSFSMQINFPWWQQLEADMRNLLWWHELARIRQHSVGVDQQVAMVGLAGLCVATSQLITQDIVLMAIGLTTAGLAGFKIYQRQCGEQYLRQLALADREAITLAEEFGYSAAAAYGNLHSALKILTRQVTKGSLAKVYRTRLQVLEICQQQALLAAI